MPYYGPISKGCERCRRRKIKCGQQRPSCEQCIKAKCECIGYRNRADLVFRSENARFSGKTEAFEIPSSASLKALIPHDRPPTKCRSPQQALQRAGGFSYDLDLESWSGPLHYALLPSVHDRAAGYFFANFVYSDAPVTSYFGDYARDRYSFGSTEDALSSAMKALGLAGVANISKAETDLSEARRGYGRALYLTNKALSNPNEAVSDSALSAIWFLAMVENVSAQSTNRYNSWHIHIEGAMALIDMRGMHQFRSELGRLLFFKFRAQILSSCLQRNVPMPDHIADWMRRADSRSREEDQQHTDSVTACTDLAIDVSAMTPTDSAIKLCNLRAAIANKTVTDSREIIAAAQEIDKGLSDMLSRDSELALGDCHMVFTASHSDDVFQGRIELHGDCARAQSRNHLRNMSILANLIIHRQCERLRAEDDEGMTAEEEVSAWHAAATIAQLCRDVCSSVPYMLGTLPPEFDTTPRRRPEVADALAVLWPLFSCAGSELASGDMRRWARGRLLYINHVFGVRQAGLMVEVLDR